MAGKRCEELRHSWEQGHLLGLHDCEGRLGIEPVGQNRGAADEELHTEHGVQPEDVERGDHEKRDVGGGRGGARARLDLLEVREHAAVSQHGRLGEPGRARGEQQRGRIAGLALDDPGVRPGTGDELGRSERRPAGLRQLPAGDLLRRPDDDGGGPDTGELLG